MQDPHLLNDATEIPETAIAKRCDHVMLHLQLRCLVIEILILTAVIN